MCECYKIGGPFIAEDPDCPIHGTEARQREESRENELEQLRRRIDRLEVIVENLANARHD